ncbi:MAG TPA: peptidase T [Saprospiraceae bacterium]|nr:peptidase T [Saprospiraceae bacterium]HQW55840.1 peptidase T [Saprospiraceae bacterium]
MQLPTIRYSVTDRFLRYVTIDTQSDPESETVPSTEKQKNLGRMLVEELLSLGISDAHLDELGYVYATIESNTTKQVPVICLCSHMDTSPDSSGENVVPIIHRDYKGEKIILPLDKEQVLSTANHPELANQIGNDIITASGDTLLGADNKAGLAEIMDACEQLMKFPEIEHGKIRILFTPDEEIGRGVDHVDMAKLGADFGYTMDGETAGQVEDENFNAMSATIRITGVAAHPGFAKGKMENAIKIMQHILQALPTHTLSPETTDGKQPFIHPTSAKGNLEQAEIHFILRSFATHEMDRLEDILEAICVRIGKAFPNSKITMEVKEQYRNMKEIIDQHPQVADYAIEAVSRAGLTPIRASIRGGTDGARLSFMGLPCPNIFAGEHAFHGKQEWVSVQDMERAVDTILHLVNIWAEKS